MTCPVCQKEEAIKDAVYGILPGLRCQEKRRENPLPNPSEMVGEDILQQRQKYQKTIVQPFNTRGDFSEEYYDAWGTKGVSVTPEQVRKRKRIWDKTVSINTDITKTK